MYHNSFRGTAGLLAACLMILCCGCGNRGTDGLSEKPLYEPGKTHVLVPEAGQEDVLEAGPLTLDFSHMDQGYFMGTLSSSDKKVNIQVIGPDQVTYKYFLSEEGVHSAFPFTAGDGSYIVLAFEEAGGGQYAALLSHSLTLELRNEFLPFLYPNQYVSFTPESEAVALAAQLTGSCETDLDALTAIYNYVTEHITYDDDKAANVETGYLPDIDETLRTGRGICFDYAALTCAMLRALSIPARLNIGYSGDIRHAWVDIYIESTGWVRNAVHFAGDEWELMDPTYASALDNDDLLKEYIGEGDNYTLLYVR